MRSPRSESRNPPWSRLRSSPVPQITKEIEEVTKLVPGERIQERVAEETVDVPATRLMEDSTEALKLSRMAELASERVVEQIVDVSVPETMEGTMKMRRSMPKEQVRECICGGNRPRSRGPCGGKKPLELRSLFHGTGSRRHSGSTWSSRWN